MNRSVKKIKKTRIFFKESILSFSFLRLLKKINKTHISGALVFLVFIGIFAFFIPHDLYAMAPDAQSAGYFETEGDTGGGLMAWLGKKAYGGLAGIISFICIKLLDLISLITIIAGTLFDYTVDFPITKLTTNLDALKDGINDAWTVLRDLANMLFIFVLLYISIATILQLGGIQTKRLLKNVIIIALLINFSMFFTHIIIDVTNSVAVAFHNAAQQVAIDGATAAGSYDASKPPTISHSFLHASAITSIYSEESGKNLKNLADGKISGILGLAAVGGSFLMVLSFVLFAGAFFLIARLVMFIILIILSPLAFIAAILPQTSGLFKKWSRSLTNNALFAPVFMALLFASLKVLEAAEDGGVLIDPSTSNLSKVAQGTVQANMASTLDPDASAVMFRTILAIGMLFASLLIAKNLSIHGANRATAIGSRWGKAALGASTAGMAARGARRTIGAGAARIKDSEKMKEWSSSSNPFRAKMATMGLGVADKTAKSSFDVRATGVAGDSLGKSGGKGGYDAIRDKNIKKEKERMKRVAPSDKTVGNAEVDLERYRKAHEEAKASGDEYRIKTTEESLRKAQEKNDRIKGVSEKQAQERQKETREKAEKELGTKDTDRSNMAPEEVQELERKIENKANEIAKKEGKTLESLGSAKERRQRAYKETTGEKNIFGKTQGDIRTALEKELSKKPEDKQKEDIIAAVKEEMGKQQSS